MGPNISLAFFFKLGDVAPRLVLIRAIGLTLIRSNLGHLSLLANSNPNHPCGLI